MRYLVSGYNLHWNGWASTTFAWNSSYDCRYANTQKSSTSPYSSPDMVSPNSLYVFSFFTAVVPPFNCAMLWIRSPEFNDFLRECFVKDPNQRKSAEELLKVKLKGHEILFSQTMQSIGIPSYPVLLSSASMHGSRALKMKMVQCWGLSFA